ncbi:MAG: ABC transporter permease, partial [Myxococcota bacterium]
MSSFAPETDEGLPGDTIPPSSRRISRASIVAPDPTPNELRVERAFSFLVHLGQISKLFAATIRSAFSRPVEVRSTINQMAALGVQSLGIASVVALFTGLVMATQFAYGLQKFGGMEYTGRIVGISFARELAPALTALVVGGRIGSGITAEIGSMAVTEQIDAIRALGADPVKKLVLPRLLASTLVMPVLAAFALVLGFIGAMFITYVEFNLPASFFLSTALESVKFSDYFSGMFKTPFFGAIIAILG